MRPDLEAIEKRANAAEPGPWDPCWSFEGATHHDFLFATHAREDIPALLAYIRHLEAAGSAQADLEAAFRKGVQEGIRREMATAALRGAPPSPAPAAPALRWSRERPNKPGLYLSRNPGQTHAWDWQPFRVPDYGPWLLPDRAEFAGPITEPMSTPALRDAPLPGVEGVTGAPDPGPLPLEIPDINLVAWEDGEKVITVGGKVVGHTLTDGDGRSIRDWLQSAIREIWEMRALDHENFPAQQLRARLIQRINENSLLLEQLEAVHRIWLDWRENGMANAITKAGEYMHKIGKVVDPGYPTDRLRTPEPSGTPSETPAPKVLSLQDHKNKKALPIILENIQHLTEPGTPSEKGAV